MAFKKKMCPTGKVLRACSRCKNIKAMKGHVFKYKTATESVQETNDLPV